MKHLGITVLCIFCNLLVWAQSGARLTALSKQSVALRDDWNAFANPAGILTPHTFSFSLAHERYGFDPDVGTSAAIAKFRIKNMSAAIGITRFGTAAYREMTYLSAYALEFGNFSLGAGLQLHTVTIPEIPDNRFLELKLGTQLQLSEQWTIGAVIENFHEQLNSWTVGLAYRPFPHVFIATSWKNHVNQKAGLGFGLEYHVTNYLAARIGVSSKPYNSTFGFSYHWKVFKFQLAITNNPLGNKYIGEMNYVR